MTTPHKGVYAVAIERTDLSTAEAQVIESVRNVQREGAGYGEVVITIKAGQITAVRREHIRHLNGAGGSV